MVKFAVLKGFKSIGGIDLTEPYEIALKKLNLKYDVIDLYSTDFINKIEESDCEIFLHRPPDKLQTLKTIHDERIFIIEKILKKKVSPNYTETVLYENKRMMSYFCALYEVPTVETIVALKKSDAEKFRQKYLKIVCKSNIGSAGTGVSINESKLTFILKNIFIFGSTLIRPSLGIFRVGKFRKIPMIAWWYVQRDYRILQNYYKIKWEWRVIVIGSTISAHKKLIRNGKASGSDLVGWDNPPDEILNLAKNVIHKMGIFAAAIDIFEAENGEYYVNEIQSVYLSMSPFQMKIDNIPGIYEYKHGKRYFQPGEHHQNSGFELRIKELIKANDTLQNQPRGAVLHV